MHNYTPGDEQYCKQTTRKTRAEADLRVRRSARSSLTTGKGTHHLPFTGSECPRLQTQVRSHTCEPPRLTTRPFSLPPPHALTTRLTRVFSHKSSTQPHTALAASPAALPPLSQTSTLASQRPFLSPPPSPTLLPPVLPPPPPHTPAPAAVRRRER